MGSRDVITRGLREAPEINREYKLRVRVLPSVYALPLE
jgi:hypothetical protein